MEITEHFDAYLVTNGQYRKKTADVLAVATALGCTGAINGEPETRTLVKRCEGVVTEERLLIDKMNMTFRGHMPVGGLRDVLGLTDKGLVTGVYGYGKSSIAGKGNLTFEVKDMYEENTKLIAFPNISWTGGMTVNLENGLDEVAEVEVTFSALADENGFFYYETFEKTVTGWTKEFTSELVASPTI